MFRSRKVCVRLEQAHEGSRAWGRWGRRKAGVGG